MKFRRFGQLFTSLLVVAVMLMPVTSVMAAPRDTVRVWVSYQSDRKAEVFQALDKAKATFHYDFPELGAYVVTLPEAALNGIVHNPNVIEVEEDPERYPVEPVESVAESTFADAVDATGLQVVPWGIDAVQARDVWDTDRDAVVDEGAPDGSEITVCVIDTGYYTGHEDLTDTQVAGVSQVDGEWYTDGVGHGSHVAGTISAMNNALGVVGVNPGMVNFFIVKIFDNSGAWTSASNLVSAIYSCRDNGANVISMSLSGTKANKQEEKAFNALYAAGILHIAAAGNEQEDTPDASHYPALYSSVISVAAVDSDLAVAVFSLQNSQVELAGPGVGVLSTIPYVETNTVTAGGVVYSANHVEYSAYGIESGVLADGGLCLTGGEWAGKVVLCQRGTNSFYEKVMAVQSSGGIAAVIYNNLEGNFLGTLGDGASSDIVAVSLSLADGLAMLGDVGDVVTVTSTHTWPTSGYEAWDGTSMATPHVAGVAALVWSANPSWTNVQIREALDETALDLGAAGRDVATGYGLVQAYDALVYLGGGTTTGELTVSITSPEEGSLYHDRNNVTISLLAAVDGTAKAGVNVSVVLTNSLGSTVNTFSGVTGSDGTVSFNYRISTRKIGTGQFFLNATATLDGASATAAPITFFVE